jgi:hypothetical protein
MPAIQQEATFRDLRQVLVQSAARFTVAADSATRFCLEAPVGPATLQAWGGKRKRSTIPVAWIDRGKSYVSFHLMGIDGRDDVVANLSDGLRARMQGRTCFNFVTPDAELFEELQRVTQRTLSGMRTAGYIVP